MGTTVPIRICADPHGHGSEAFHLAGAVLLGPVNAEVAGLHLEVVQERNGDVESWFWWKIMRCRCTFIAAFDGSVVS